MNIVLIDPLPALVGIFSSESPAAIVKAGELESVLAQ
jgi:hypothetical protein